VSHSNTITNQQSTTNTSGNEYTAAYNITGPQLSDNYTGPATYNVYADNIYGTFAFYSDLEQPVTLGTIGVSPQYLFFQPTAVGSLSASQSVTLTNNSIYPLTMVYPAVTFDDPGFQLVEDGTDKCSNRYLAAGASCTLNVKFIPVISDAPNQATGQNYPSVQATMIAAGTENASSYQNILITSHTPVSGVVTGNAGATLIADANNPTTNANGVTLVNALPNAYAFSTATISQTGSTLSANTQSEPYTFTNYYSTAVQVNTISLTDNTDYAITSDGCIGTVLSGQSCQLTLNYSPSSSSIAAEHASYPTGINVYGTVYDPNSVTNSAKVILLATAGATGTIPEGNLDVQEVDINPPPGGDSGEGSYTFTNNTGYAITIQVDNITLKPPSEMSVSGDTCTIGTVLAIGASCGADVQFDGTGSPGSDGGVVIVDVSGTTASGVVYGNGTEVAANTSAPNNIQFLPITTPTPSQTVSAGGVAAYVIQVAPTSTLYPGMVSFLASGLPTGATASFSPSTLAANAGAQNVMMSVQTPANLVDNAPSNIKPHGPAVYLGWLVLPLAGFFGARRRRKGILRLMSVLILLVAGGWAAIGVTGCSSGGGGTAGTTTVVTHTYAITVTATSAGVSQSTSVILNIQ
jgi:hypothetical protein